MRFLKIFVAIFLISMAIGPLQGIEIKAEDSPVTNSHISRINDLFRQNNVPKGFVVLDRYGRLELKGEYSDEREVDRAFSLAQTVVGAKWVSPVTPEEIKVKAWEKSFSDLFKRANVLTPATRGDEPPGPIRNRYALIVGIGKFIHEKQGISPLEFTVKDATNFYQFLIDPKRGGFPKNNVIFLTDQNATRNNIAKAFDQISSLAQPDDLVTIYMSTHGTPPDKFGGVHIVTYDTKTQPREEVWYTSITDAMLKDFIENLKAKRLVMILDICFSNGAFKNIPGFLPPGGKSIGVTNESEGYSVSKKQAKRILGAKDIIVEEPTYAKNEPSGSKGLDDGWGKVLISASSENEKSWESYKFHNSIFTYHFIKGLTQNNGDIRDAFYYSKPLVNADAIKEWRDEGCTGQHPQVSATNKDWDMRLSQARAR